MEQFRQLVDGDIKENIMVEKYLGKERARDIFLSAFASEVASSAGIEKTAQGPDLGLPKFIYEIARDVGHAGIGGIKNLAGLLKEVPSGLLWTMGLGAGTGFLGATGYDAIKERIMQEDPEAKFNDELETIYAERKREKEDAKWMDRARKMRDELKRGYKKMTTDEYSAKYKALLDHLDERKP